ncbi:LOW QUALITY PROTEIN: MORN repeat-containing protein 1 [Pterocles gutturalis]
MASLAERRLLPLPGQERRETDSVLPRHWSLEGEVGVAAAPSSEAGGQDKLFFKDGSYCEDTFVNGEIMGNGFQYWGPADLFHKAEEIAKMPAELEACGQWKNDVFGEQGAIVDCSGDICDGLWINGYPAVRQKGGKKPSGRISAEKAEKMTVSQEKMEDSRSRMKSKEYKLQKDQRLIKNSKTLQGQYVLMLHEVTVSPFLGQTLTPAFKLLIFPEKTKIKNKDSFKVTSK